MTKSKLHPGAKWSFRLAAYLGIIFPMLFILFFLTGLIGEISSFGVVLIVIIIGLILAVIFGEIFARMAYNRWFYEFTPDALRIEKGIIWKRYKSIPYERVQNVDIHRGILARILGFSTLDIQTAGYGGFGGRGGRPRAEGHIPAVTPEAAEKIREFLIKKIKGKKSGGL